MEDAVATASAAPATQDTCFGTGSVAGAVIGTFLTTILLLAVAALLYRQWRRHKSESHLFHFNLLIHLSNRDTFPSLE